MRALFKIARFKKEVILMTKRMLLVTGLATAILIAAPIVGYSEETVSTLTVEQEVQAEMQAFEEDSKDSPDGRTFREKMGGLWNKVVVTPYKKVKEQASDFGQEIIGTDERIERKQARIEYLQQEVIRWKEKAMHKEAAYGLELQSAKSCVDNLNVFLDGLEVK